MQNNSNWVGSSVSEEILAMARDTISKAESGDHHAARTLLLECAVALRGIVESGELPNAERQQYLIVLLDSLEKIIDGVEPARALCLEKAPGRPLVPGLEVRDIGVFFAIGRRYEGLKQSGAAKCDKPVGVALRETASEFKLTVAATQKIWSSFGALKGWAYVLANWK